MKTRAITTTVLFLLFFLPLAARAQNGPHAAYKVKSEDWQDLSINDQCKIQYRYMVCDLREDGIVKEEVYLRVANFSNTAISVSWDLELIYGERCYNCHGENDELKIAFTIQPNEVFQGSCGDDNKYHLRLFSKFMNGEADSKLSDFNLRNLKINSL